MTECHCGKDGHALGSINCPVHGYGPWREGIVRIIDPEIIGLPRINLNRKRYDEAFAKADAIIKLWNPCHGN